MLLIGACTPQGGTQLHSNDSGQPSIAGSDTSDDTESNAPPKDSGTPVETVPEKTYPPIGVVLIDTDGGVSWSGETDAWMEVIRSHDGTLTDLMQADRTWRGPIGIEIHGSSSTGFPKLGYRIEIRDEAGEDEEHGLLGMNEESDFVFHGPYSDKTLIRNAMAYQFARLMAEDTGHWQPNTRWAEVFIDDSYQGVYLVVERIKRDNLRLDLNVPAETNTGGDVTGGYILKIDQHRGDGWTTSQGTPIDYHYPKTEDLTLAQTTYLQTYFEDFEDSLSSSTGPVGDDSYGDWIDVESFIDTYLLNELALNIDGLRLSAYLYKTADENGGLLAAGPAWDFNLAFGNADYCDAWYTSGFTIDVVGGSCGIQDQYPFWWNNLRATTSWENQARCRWETLREDRLSDLHISLMLDEYQDTLATVEARDQAKWNTLGVYVWPNYFIGDTWPEELEYLEDWVLNRAQWLDDWLPGTCDE